MAGRLSPPPRWLPGCLITLLLLLPVVIRIIRRLLGPVATQTRGQPDPKEMDAPPPTIPEGYLKGEPGTLKYVLLLGGAQVAHMVVRQRAGAATYELVYGPQGSSPFDPGGEWPPSKPIRDGWVSCVRRYAGKPFKDDQWELVALRPYSQADIDTALDEIKKKNPLALVVHYLGHGNSDTTGPFLTLTAKKATKIQATDKATKIRVKIDTEIPDELARVNGYYTEKLATKLLDTFPDKIPKTLVVDGCELGPTLDYAKGSRNLHVVAAVTESKQETIWAKFSELWGNSDDVKPAAFEKFGGSMDAPVTAVNKLLAKEPKTKVNIATGPMKTQEASWK
jgi:hypothetical protein